MYHYVRPASVDLPYLRYLDFENFRRQLDYFDRTFGFAKKNEFLAALEGGKPIPQNRVILTFDDGLIDHWRWVTRELRARDLWGIFYVPTGPYVHGKLLGVHRIHWLLGRYGGSRMMAALEKRIGSKMLSHAHVEEFRRLTYRSQINRDETNLFKRTLNYFISYEWREQVLDGLMKELCECEEQLIRDYYVSTPQLREMQDQGMVIGSHSVNHPVFSKLPVEEQLFELSASFEFLEHATGGLSIRTFCYPYGGFHSFTADTERMLSELDCRFSFNVEYRDIGTADLSRLQALPRYDCNLFEHGEASGSA